MILSVGLWYCPRPCLRVEHSLRIFCRVHTYPFSCIRASSLVTRNFASARERNSGGYFPKIPKLASSLRRIVLPDTWKGRRAARRAKQHWVDITKDLTGSEPPKNAPGHKEPLLLFIDDQPTTSKTTIYPHAIVFRQEDDLGQRLWRIAHPIPWSEKSCWIRWPTYALVSLYTSLFIFWLICRERVPITGRRQFRCLPVQTLLHTQELPVGENEKERLLPDDDHRVVRAQSVLDRVLLASGLAHLKWKLVVLNEPNICNAEVVPLGFVIMCSGIFAAAETDDEIAAVMSHEMAHVLGHHWEARVSGVLIGIFALSPALPFILASYVIGEFAVIAVPPIAVGVAIMLALSRGREAEADYIGMLLMTEAGFDPSATISVFDKIDKIEQKALEIIGIERPAQYMSTHPHPASRMSQAALDVPKILYMTGRGPLPAGLSTRELRKIEESKRRWEAFLQERISWAWE